MKTVSAVMAALKKLGSAQTRKIYAKHGAPEDMFGVSVANLKTVAKKIKGNQEMAMELYETGNSDAMYLAGMVADGSLMKKAQLDKWAKAATWYYVSEHAVPGVACENKDAKSLALKWMKSRKEHVAACGWCTYSGVIAMSDDSELDKKEIEGLLKQIEKDIHSAPNRVRYTMNGFVIGVGGYMKGLSKKATATAKKVGKVEVNVGDTSCKVPFAPDYIKKIVDSGRLGKKRKTVKCSS
jgi:3-methyladenine DNA glycosylase AlkD